MVEVRHFRGRRRGDPGALVARRPHGTALKDEPFHALAGSDRSHRRWRMLAASHRTLGGVMEKLIWAVIALIFVIAVSFAAYGPPQWWPW